MTADKMVGKEGICSLARCVDQHYKDCIDQMEVLIFIQSDGSVHDCDCQLTSGKLLNVIFSCTV